MTNMETNKELDNFLKQKLSPDQLEAPSPALLSEARKKVIARRPAKSEVEDFFLMIAAFLNFKVKLYQAVLVVALIGCVIFVADRSKKTENSDRVGEEYSNIASVHSSTVLSSICTSRLIKKPL